MTNQYLPRGPVGQTSKAWRCGIANEALRTRFAAASSCRSGLELVLCWLVCWLAGVGNSRKVGSEIRDTQSHSQYQGQVIKAKGLTCCNHTNWCSMYGSKTVELCEVFAIPVLSTAVALSEPEARGNFQIVKCVPCCDNGGTFTEGVRSE